MKKNNKKIVLLIGIFVVLIAVLVAAYGVFRAKPTAGAKAITIEVVDNNGATKTYSTRTDAEYLRGAMEGCEGLEFSGSESEFGLYVEMVNGVTADYNADGAYWSFYVNGDFCNYGIDQQPVADKDSFSIKYEVYKAE